MPIQIPKDLATKLQAEAMKINNSLNEIFHILDALPDSEDKKRIFHAVTEAIKEINCEIVIRIGNRWPELDPDRARNDSK